MGEGTKISASNPNIKQVSMALCKAILFIDDQPASVDALPCRLTLFDNSLYLDRPLQFHINGRSGDAKIRFFIDKGPGNDSTWLCDLPAGHVKIGETVSLAATKHPPKPEMETDMGIFGGKDTKKVGPRPTDYAQPRIRDAQARPAAPLPQHPYDMDADQLDQGIRDALRASTEPVDLNSRLLSNIAASIKQLSYENMRKLAHELFSEIEAKFGPNVPAEQKQTMTVHHLADIISEWSNKTANGKK